MNILRFLREQAKGYDCSVCGQNHARSDIRVLGKLESAWIVRVTCAKCKTSFKLLVVIDEERAAVSPVQEASGSHRPTRERRRPAVSADEVLDAHEFLQGYAGDVSGMLSDETPVQPARPDGSA
ncbi:MAG TPA: hypothetical protein VHG53_03740 [Candidatus Limnocylindria bacterium]|nr:hypothetical protein [Candidatus Limnocylindria bacterium]